MVNLYKICGLLLEKFEEPKTRWLKFLKFWPFGIAFVHVIIMVYFTVRMIMFFCLDQSYSLRADYAGIILISSLQLRGLIDLSYTFLHRKTEQKFWNALDQLDDFFVRFLDIKMNYKKENWLHLRKLIFVIFVNISFGVTMSVLNYTASDKFNSYYGSSSILVFMNQFYLNKFLFYISIVYNRVYYLTKNYTRIEIHDYKLKVMPHTCMITWKLIKIVKSRFTIPLIFTTFHIYVMIVFFGFVLAQDLAIDKFNVAHIISIISPQINIWFICFNSWRICRIVSSC